MPKVRRGHAVVAHLHSCSAQECMRLDTGYSVRACEDRSGPDGVAVL